MKQKRVEHCYKCRFWFQVSETSGECVSDVMKSESSDDEFCHVWTNAEFACIAYEERD